MTKIDDSYMERLKEVIYDEKKAINYKMVSIMLGVHVNIAKQMLYHFYSSEKELGKRVYATFYVSGMLPRKMLNSIGRKDERSHDSNSSHDSYCSPSDELDSFLVLLCRDKDLEEYKPKFSKIFSIHVYALSGFPLENYDTLERLVDEPLRDSEGRTPVDFGPITCSAAQKLKANVQSVPVAKDVARAVTAKEAPKPKAFFGNGKASEDKKGKLSAKEETKKSETISDGIEEAQLNKSKPVKVADPTKKVNDNRLKSMFATQATKPKPKVVPVVESKKNSSTSSNKPKDSSISKSETKATKSDTRKRKRIRDVLSSSESEEEKDSDVEESLPESPVPKRRIQIESDSDDDDFKKEPSKPVEPEKPPVTAATDENKSKGSGRRRVAKMVSKSFLDKDGFLVTTKEQVMVSEDEASDSEKPKNGNQNGKSLQKPDEQKPAKPVNGLAFKKSPGGTGKAKQSSLMSFFQKK